SHLVVVSVLELAEPWEGCVAELLGETGAVVAAVDEEVAAGVAFEGAVVTELVGGVELEDGFSAELSDGESPVFWLGSGVAAVGEHFWEAGRPAGVAASEAVVDVGEHADDTAGWVRCRCCGHVADGERGEVVVAVEAADRD